MPNNESRDNKKRLTIQTSSVTLEVAPLESLSNEEKQDISGKVSREMRRAIREQRRKQRGESKRRGPRGEGNS